MKKLKCFGSKQRITEYSTTHQCFTFILILGQCFAMFPIKGLMTSDFRALQFSWVSWSMFHTFLYLSGIVLFFCFHVFHAIKTYQLKFGYFVTFLFFFTSLTTVLLFIRLARGWPQLMKKWSEIDFRMRSYGFSKKLPLNLKIISAVVLLAAFVEHGLYLATAITNIKEEEGWDKISRFLETTFEFVFTYVHFAIWKAIILLMINFMCTFTWNYMDLFIMLISTALTVKFKQITKRLRTAASNKFINALFWKDVRSDYNAVCGLCNIVDNAISDIVLLSFANNLFVLLVQLFNSLKPRNDSIIGRIYFLYSFAFLVLRTVAVCLYAARINEASKEPTALLLSVSPEAYNIEIERFLYKIQADPCALTGRKFFNVTKTLILNIAGAIVTYELVLIQFEVVT